MAWMLTKVWVGLMSDLWTRLTTSESLTRKDLYPLCLEAADEIERLRALIAAWVDADEAWEPPFVDDFSTRLACIEAAAALRKAVGR